MTEIIKKINFSDFYLTMIHVLKIVAIFKAKEKFLLTSKRIVMFDFYMRFPFMTDEERDKQNFDEKYAFYFWKPNYSLYEAVLAILISKEFIFCEEGIYHIKEKGEEVLCNIECEYMRILSNTGEYILNTVTKMSEKRIEEDIIKKSSCRWEGIS